MRKYRLHWTLHPEKSVEWYEEQKERLTEDSVARELDINYALSVSGKVFSNFNAVKHVSDEKPKVNTFRPVFRIWDFGKTSCVLYVQCDEYGRKTVLFERIVDMSDTFEQVQIALQDSKERFYKCRFVDICDPAGSYDDGRGHSTHVDILNDEGIYPVFDTIRSLATKFRKQRGIEMIQKDLQQAPGGKEAFTLYEKGCPILKKAFEGGYAYKKDAMGNQLDKIDEKHPYEDVMDCLIYFYIQSDGGRVVDDTDYEPVYTETYINPYIGF